MRILAIGCLLAAAFALPGVALAQENGKAAEAGRYTITFSAEGLYFLDTATGALWLKPYQGEMSNGKWLRVDSPVNAVSGADEVPVKEKQRVSLTVSEDGVTMPMIQRERRKIPGSSESLFVKLGDITGGQVFVEVTDVNGDYLVERTSLKNDEFLDFDLDGTTYYLQIREMINNLTGEDICKVRITTTKPQVETNEAAGDAGEAAGETADERPDES